MKFCPNCGSPLEEGAVTCPNCGDPLTLKAEPAPAPYVDPMDHTGEFDAADISENKVIAMLPYILGVAGLIIALLARSDSLRQIPRAPVSEDLRLRGHRRHLQRGALLDGAGAYCRRHLRHYPAGHPHHRLLPDLQGPSEGARHREQAGLPEVIQAEADANISTPLPVSGNGVPSFRLCITFALPSGPGYRRGRCCPPGTRFSAPRCCGSPPCSSCPPPGGSYPGTDRPRLR